MSRLSRGFVTGSLALLMLVRPSAARAQSDPSPGARQAVNPVRQYVSDETVAAWMSIPANFIIADVYRPVVERMLHSSQTFRRQCARLAAAPRWAVFINVRSTPRRYGVRAVTAVTPQLGGRMAAFVEVFETGSDVELIAHELEHVLEQIDGVDLRSLVARRDSGVRSVSTDHPRYETRRAARVGAMVSREVSAAAPES